MSLDTDIEEIIKNNKKLTKKQILKEHVKEIKKMLDNGFTYDMQIQLLIKNGIVKKLSRSEYYTILKNLGVVKEKKSVVVETIQEVKEVKTQTPPQKNLNQIEKNNVLKEDVDLLSLMS